MLIRETIPADGRPAGYAVNTARLYIQLASVAGIKCPQLTAGDLTFQEGRMGYRKAEKILPPEVVKNAGSLTMEPVFFALYIHLLKIICPSGLYRHQNITYPPVLYLYQNINSRLIKMFAYNMQKGCIISNFTIRPIDHNHQLIKF